MFKRAITRERKKETATEDVYKVDVTCPFCESTHQVSVKDLRVGYSIKGKKTHSWTCSWCHMVLPPITAFTEAGTEQERLRQLAYMCGGLRMDFRESNPGTFEGCREACDYLQWKIKQQVPVLVVDRVSPHKSWVLYTRVEDMRQLLRHMSVASMQNNIQGAEDITDRLQGMVPLTLDQPPELVTLTLSHWSVNTAGCLVELKEYPKFVEHTDKWYTFPVGTNVVIAVPRIAYNRAYPRLQWKQVESDEQLVRFHLTAPRFPIPTKIEINGCGWDLTMEFPKKATEDCYCHSSLHTDELTGILEYSLLSSNDQIVHNCTFDVRKEHADAVDSELHRLLRMDPSWCLAAELCNDAGKMD